MSRGLFFTKGINEACKDQRYHLEIVGCLVKFAICDWGDTCKEDCELNDVAIKNGDRVVALYKTSKGNVFIILETEHKMITVLFGYEY